MGVGTRLSRLAERRAVRGRALRWLGVGAVVALLGLSLPAVRAQVAPRALREREFVGGGAWSWFGDPRAVYHQGAHRRSYVGWDAPDGSIQVASYDHDTGQQVIATLKARFQVDDHDNPSILVLPDGRLMVFWSAHAGPQMFYRISTHPEDVTAWGPEHTVPTNTSGTFGYTYPNPIQLPAEGNRLYLFWRGGNFNPTLSTTTSLGTTWSPARTLISVPGQRPYIKFASNDRDTIAMAFTQAHPRNGQTNIYYAAYRAGALHHADGSTIAPMASLPITPAQADKVYDWTTDGKAWVHDVALDAAGRPVIVYATFPTDTDHRYRYARWDGSRWIDRELTRAGGSMNLDPNEPNYSGGITLDHEDPSTVYLSRQVNGVFEVQVWRTPDGGATWSSVPLTSRSVRGNYRPLSPRGEQGQDLDVVWMHGGYPSYVGFQTGLRTQLHSRDFADPSAASWAAGRLDVFARDAQDGELLQKYFNGAWSGWVDFRLTPGGHAFGSPTVASWGKQHLDLFATDATTGHLLQRTFDSGWRGWVDRGLAPGGHPVAAPAAVSWGFGRIDVVARDQTTNQLVHWWQSGSTWSGPQILAAGPGGAFRSAVDARAFQHLDVFGLASAGRVLAHWWYDGAWHGPQNLGTGSDRIALAGLGVTSWDSTRLDLFATDAAQHGLVQDFSTGAWVGPVHLDFPMGAAAVPAAQAVAAPVAVMADPNPRDTPIPVDAKARASD